MIASLHRVVRLFFLYFFFGAVDYTNLRKKSERKSAKWVLEDNIFFIPLSQNSNGGVREYRMVTLAEIIHIAPVQIMLTLEVWSLL